jgi:uncharacterized protein
VELVNRLDEMERLRRACAEAPQLVVVRGRRRVGKSFLLSHAFADHRLLYFQADEQDQSGQLSLFAREAGEIVPGRPPLRFADWDEALGFLGGQAETAPLVVVLDEFQWLWAAQPALDSLIQRHWDRWQRAGTPITMVLSGSSLNHMQRLLEADRPLYGRAGYRPLLEPLDVRWAARFSDSDEPDELLRRYAVIGGTPQYQVWAGRGPVLEAIATRILMKGEPLYEEPLHLLREEPEIRSPGNYFEIMRAIAAGATRHNEIAQRAQLETPLLAPRLARLTSLGYLEHRRPLEPRGFAGRRGFYRIRDPFFRFWFRYVFPNRSRLERGRVDEVLALVEADLDNYMGPAFEDLCRDWVARRSADLPEAAEVGSWWDRAGSHEVDIVTTARGRYTMVGSCKWSRSAGTDALSTLRSAVERLGPKAARARLAVFARGFDAPLAEVAAREHIRLVAAAELLR